MVSTLETYAYPAGYHGLFISSASQVAPYVDEVGITFTDNAGGTTPGPTLDADFSGVVVSPAPSANPSWTAYAYRGITWSPSNSQFLHNAVIQNSSIRIYFKPSGWLAPTGRHFLWTRFQTCKFKAAKVLSGRGRAHPPLGSSRFG